MLQIKPSKKFFGDFVIRLYGVTILNPTDN